MSFLQDLKFAFWTFLRNPGFSIVATLALTLGIGAVALTVAFASAYLWRPLPFRDPARLVHIWATDERLGFDSARVSYPDFKDWKESAKSFQDMGLFNYAGDTLTGGEQPERVAVGRVSANTLELLGVPPLLGRTFSPGEDLPGASPVVVLSEKFWRSRYGDRPDVIGQTLEINQVKYTIIGVMPESFVFPLPVTQFWTPYSLDEKVYGRDRSSFQVVARLRDGVSAQEAEAELVGIAKRLATNFPETNENRGARFQDLRGALNFADEIFKIAVATMFAANLLVLLLACANVSSLSLGRVLTRDREVAIRAAMGASKVRLVRQFMTESFFIALIGGGLGLLVSLWAVDLSSQVIPDDLYRVGEPRIDGLTVLAVLGTSALAALLFGSLPSMVASGKAGAVSLQGGTRSTTGQRHLRLQDMLVVTEVAVALLLLVGTSLLVQSLNRLNQVDPGFNPAQRILTVELSLPSQRYTTDDLTRGFYDRILEAVQASPGVAAASTIDYIPLNHESRGIEYTVPGLEPPPDGRPRGALHLRVDKGYFETMGIPVISGRTFRTEDEATVLINESLANSLFGPGVDPRERILELEKERKPFRIIGVVGDTRHSDLTEAGTPQIYTSMRQEPSRYFRVVVRSAGPDATQLAASARQAVWAVDPNLPINSVRTMAEVVDEFLLPQKAIAGFLSILSTGAILLAVVGVYGLLSFFVSRRQKEIGVRMAVGANKSAVIRLVLGRGLRLGLAGLVLGLIGSVAVGQLLESQIFGVTLLNPISLLFAPGALILAILAACYFPARRAASLDPVSTLRWE